MEKYNGWSNKPTWIWNLYNQGDYWHERAREIYKEGFLTVKETVYQLESEIKETTEEFNPLGVEANLYAELLSFAIAWIDFHEIAETIVDETLDE